MRIILSLAILLFIVMIHEWGHFIAGRISGVRVYEFAIGFGPKIFSWFKNGTRFSIRILPLGGFCSFDPDETKTTEEEKAKYESFDDSKYTYLPNASFGKKMFIILNGIIMNFILAFLIFSFIFGFYGTQTMYVDETIPGSIADTLDISKDDKIISINGREVNSIFEFTKDKDFLSEDGFKLIILRGDEKKIVNVPSLKKEGSFGVKFQLTHSISNAVASSLSMIWDMLKQIWNVLRRIFIKVDNSMMGIVGFMGFMNKQEGINFLMILTLLGGLSVSVGAFNLLPIIPLDGGQAVIYIIEKIIRRPLSDRARAVISYVGMAFVLYLFIRVTYNDILRLR